MTTPLILYATEAYEYLQDEMCALGGFERGAIERRRFPDGERYLRLDTLCAGRDVAIVGGTISETDTLEIYDVACSLVKYGARRLTLVIPFFGYSTMERAARPGEVVTAKTRARLLSSVPTAALGNRVIAMDLHAAGIIHYFEGGVQPVHIQARRIIVQVARGLHGADFVLACTDAGRARWVETLAGELGVTPAFVYKRRLDGERTEVTGVSAHVRDKAVIIYDDMIRTGGSLLSAAAAYRQAGAASIAAIASHGLFPGDALPRLEQSGMFTQIVCTDSHPRAHLLRSDFLQVESIASLLVHELGESL